MRSETKIADSIRERMPGVMTNEKMPSSTQMPMKMGRSYFFISLETASGTNSAAAPIATRVLKTLEPMTLPRLMAFEPASAAERLMPSSGRLVPSETSVSPMMRDGIFKERAMFDAPSTNQSAPFIRSVIPMISPKSCVKISIKGISFCRAFF